MNLQRLENSVGQQLRTAMPPVQASPELVDRILRRLETRPERLPATWSMPRVSRRLARWVVAAAVILALVASGVFLRPGNDAFPFSGPIAFAEPSAPILPGLGQTGPGWEFHLETTLPELPKRAPAYRAESPTNQWLDRAHQGSLRKLDDVALRTAKAAWADLAAGIGVSLLSVEKPPTVQINDPRVAIREVKLSQAVVSSLDHQQYVIPVVLFRGDVVGSDGVRYPAEAYVSAMQPQPNQGRYELAASLPEAPALAPAVKLQLGEIREWQPTDPIVATPSDEQALRTAARNVAALATGLPPRQLREPILRPSGTEINLLVPLALAADLPVVQMSGDPHPRFFVFVTFAPTGELQRVTIADGAADPVGEPQAIISPQAAWEQVQAGTGLVNVAGRTYPNAHFAAHRSSITRVELGYPDYGTAEAPLQPRWFFYGTAEVAEDHRTVPIVVTVPATR